MSHDPLKIDWPGLLDAVHASEDGDLRWYLDLHTGEVVPAGNELDTEGLEDWQNPEHDAGRFLHIPGESTRDGWRRRLTFTQTVAPEARRPELEDALSGRGAFRRFRDAVERLGLRDAWFRYDHETAVHDAQTWLESEGLVASNPPPTLAGPQPRTATKEPSVPGHPGRSGPDRPGEAGQTGQPPAQTQRAGAVPPVSLIELLLLGRMEGRVEVQGGKVLRRVRLATAEAAREVFVGVCKDLLRWEGQAVPPDHDLPQGRVTIGRFQLAQDGRQMELEVTVTPEQVRAFWW